MKKAFYAIAAGVFLISSAFTASSGLPQGTEVWLFDFSPESMLINPNRFSIGNGFNLSDHEGYDSQPSFSADSRYLLWTSERDSGQTEIYRYELKSAKTECMTHTAVSEYSPTYAPDGKNISCIVVEPDSTQRLWLYDKKTFQSHVMMPGVSKIGYHCWTDKNTVFCFLLTEPFSLVKCDVKTGTTKTIAQNIGRCMNHYSDKTKDYLYYTVKDSQDNTTIHAWNLKTDAAVDSVLIHCLPGSEDFARYGETLFMASGTTLYYHDLISKDDIWYPFWNLTGKLHNISRIAISPDGKHIALVDNNQ